MPALIAALCLVIALVGCICTVVEAVAVAAFGRRRRSAAEGSAAGEPGIGVTVVKPLHGAEPGLYENLLSFVAQDYQGSVQLLFGVGDAADPALGVVRRLQLEFPRRDIEAVVSPRAADGNAKIANLDGMSGSIRQELIVMSDSDIRVAPDYLRRTVALLGQPGVGLVTWLYRGEGAGGTWALLSAMAIDYHFFPSVLLGLKLGRGRPCVGATMAFSRQTLGSIGGYAAFANYLADDHAIGEAVRRTGLGVVTAPDLVVHRCVEGSAGALWQHELRWARTIRSIDPWGFAGSIVMHPLPFALAAALLLGFDPLGSAALGATLLCRLRLQWQVDRMLADSGGISLHRLLLGPLRDMLSFGVFCASFLTSAVVWRGRRYRVRADGTVAELKDPGS